MHYIRFKDAFNQKIDKIDDSGEDVEIVNKDGSKEYAVIIPFTDSISDKISGKEKVTVFMFNSKSNLDAVINEWDALKENKGLTLVFVNPFSLTETKWVLSPYLHSMTTDESSLKTGIKSMFSMVEELSEKEAKSKIK